MFSKIILFYQIKKFYKIFEGKNFITKLSDMTTDNVMSVTFDINEVLDGYVGYETLPLYSWLIKLERRCLQC
jgi:hypothetical protein